MNEPFNDELISAYLDGELTADEQALVEQALVESAECRQMFEELRSLRSDLQSLPCERLAPDFSQRVLARAELALAQESSIRAALDVESAPESSTASPPVAGTSQSARVEAAPQIVPAPARPASWSTVAWAFAALAAAMLAALYLPKIEMGPVAHTDIAAQTEISQDRDTSARQTSLEKKLENKENKALVSGQPVPAPPPRSRGLLKSEAPTPEQAGVHDDAAANLANVPRPGAALPREGVDSLLPETATEFAKKMDLQRPAAPAGLPAAPPGLGGYAPNVTERIEGGLPGVAPVAEADGLARARGADPTLLVVRFTATREALESGAFDAVLRKHNIHFDDADGLDAKELKDDKDDSARRRKSPQLAQVSAEGVDVVYVEATAGQIDAALADLRAQPRRFLGLAGRMLAEDESRGSDLYSDRNLRRVQQREIRHAEESETKDRANRGDAPVDVAKGEGGGSPAQPARPQATRGALGAGGAPLPGAAPAAPGGAASRSGSPALDLPTAEKKAAGAEFGRGAAGKPAEARAKDQIPANGIASRIAPPSFRSYDELELRKSAEADSRRYELGGGGRGASRDSLRPGDSSPARAAPDEGLEKQNFREAKPDKDKLAETDQHEKDGGQAFEREQLKRTSASGQERVRVLFVIRAVEQEADSRPE